MGNVHDESARAINIKNGVRPRIHRFLRMRIRWFLRNGEADAKVVALLYAMRPSPTFATCRPLAGGVARLPRWKLYIQRANALASLSPRHISLNKGWVHSGYSNNHEFGCIHGRASVSV